MKSVMRIEEINENQAQIKITTVYKGFDKVSEFAKIENIFSDSNMNWNKQTGEYEITIELTQENAQIFIDYAAKKQLEIVCL